MTTVITKTRQGREYQYDPTTGLFLNPETKKWVKNPLPSKRKKVSSGKHRYYGFAHDAIDTTISKIARTRVEEESIRYVLKRIAVSECTKIRYNANDPRQEENPFVWLPHELYMGLLSWSYSKCMSKLVKEGILVENIVRNPKGFFPTYRFSERRFIQEFRRVPIANDSVEGKIRKFNEWKQRHTNEIDRRVMAHIADNFPRIDLTFEQFTQLWATRYATKYLPPGSTQLPSSEYTQAGLYAWTSIAEWNMSDREEKISSMSVDSFGHRLHHVFTSAASEVRAYACDSNGAPITLTEYDLCNSQPAIFASLLMSQHGVDRHDEFVENTMKKSIYENLAKKMGVSRSEAKDWMCKFLFCRENCSWQTRFENYYPAAGRVARNFKTQETDDDGNLVPPSDRYLLIAKKLQRAESSAFRVVWQRLLNLGYTFFPVHDALYIAGLDLSKKRYAFSTIRGALKKVLKFPVKLKQKKVQRIIDVSIISINGNVV